MRMVTTDRIIDKINRLVEEELRTGGGELKILEMIGINKNLEYTQTVITVQNIKENDKSYVSDQPGIVNYDNLNDQNAVRTSSGRVVNEPIRFLGIICGPDPDFKALGTRKVIDQ